MSRSSPRLATGLTVAILSMSGAKAQTPGVPSTRDFVAAAAQSDGFEIAEARTALIQTQDPHVRAFAQEMIQAHTQTRQALQAAAAKAGAQTPEGLSGDQQRMLGALQSQRGPEFDRTYLKQQVIAPREAYVGQQGYAAQGADPDLRQAARSALPVIARHLAMAERLRSRSGED